MIEITIAKTDNHTQIALQNNLWQSLVHIEKRPRIKISLTSRLKKDS